MSYFEAKMHQIRFRLGLHPRPRGELTALPQNPLAGFKGPKSKGRRGRKDVMKRREGDILRRRREGDEEEGNGERKRK